MAFPVQYYAVHTDDLFPRMKPSIFNCELYHAGSPMGAAESHAEYLWDECDGREWMMDQHNEIQVYHPFTKKIHIFEIEIEFEPSFNAYSKDNK